MPVDKAPRDLTGIARSLRIYHRDPARSARMDALNTQFVQPGGLVFDIGAHVGDRIASFRRLGARVVAAEPQPAVMRALRLMFRRDAHVVLVPAAIGAMAGRAPLHVNGRNPTVSTLSRDFIAATQGAPGWEGQNWERVIDVPMLTLDTLIDRHGLPDFIKIDVEGHEADVLAGLGRPVRALSFEFTTIQLGVAQKALARTSALANYLFNVSFGESHALEMTDWVSAGQMSAYLSQLPAKTNSGDVYARRV